MAQVQVHLISVTWGEEMFQVVGPNGRWMHFKVGPFTYETQPMVGETMEAAWKRAWDTLNKQVDKVFLKKRNLFFEHMESLKNE
jgi:hypothetical protein